MIETRLTKLFGIQHPIISNGMMWVSRAELVAAVANAGAPSVVALASRMVESAESIINQRLRGLIR